MADDGIQTATPDKVSTAPLSIPDFATKIRKRDARLTPDLVDDATLVRKVLERKPELAKYVQSSVPRKSLKRDRTPSVDQQTQKFFENHPVVRESALGAFSGLGIPETQHPVWDMLKGVKDTVTNPPTMPDEKAFAAAGGGPMLPVYRMAKGLVQQTYGFGQEAFDSVDWQSALKNKKLPEFKEGSGGGPQFAHGLAGMATMIASVLTGGKKVPEAGEAVVRAGEKVAKVPESVTVTAQRSAETGPALAKKVASKTIEERAAAIDQDVKARQAWVQKAHESKNMAREQAKVAARKEALEHAQKSYADLIKDNVKQAHDTVRGILNDRWSKLREAVGVDRGVQAPGIYQSIEQSRGMLAGVPADLKIFNDLIKEITEKGEQVETEAGDLQRVPKESIPFDDARTQFSAVGEKAYTAEGNLRRALFNVYEAYDQALSKTATEAGQGKVYAGLKADWKSYMQDWHDMRSMATGGSPLARVYRAVDRPVVAANVLGKFSDRLVATLARYKKYGAEPNLMAKFRNLAQEEKSLPKVKVPAMPERITEAPPHPVTVDQLVEDLKKAKVEGAEKTAESMKKVSSHEGTLGLIGAYGVGGSLLGLSGAHMWYAIPYTIVKAGKMFFAHSDAARSWLSKVTPQDIAAIKEVMAKAPEHAVDIQQGIADGLVEKAKRGRKAAAIVYV